MDHVCVAVPVLEGKTQDARAFMHELENVRKGDYDHSERRVGIPKELWYLAALPSGDHLIAYLESEDFSKSLRISSESRDEFDMWFKAQMANVTGIDLNDPPEMQLPELLSHYSAEEMAGKS